MSKYLKNSPNLPFMSTPYSALMKPLVNINYSEDLIHKRVSYSFWKQITETINNPHLSTEEKVRAMQLVFNERKMFNTEKKAGFVAESAEQAILDIV